MSYTAYLSHLLVSGVIERVWQLSGNSSSSLVGNTLFATMVAAVLCYGWMGYRMFEKPVLDRAYALARKVPHPQPIKP